MVDRLISFLRATLAASRHGDANLKEEFDRLRDYLELISIRMGPRMKFSLHLPEEVATATVLPLMLQPLVENAVRHGIEPAIDGGSIDVTAGVEGEELRLIVADSGIGFAGSSPRIDGGLGEGFGLAQIRERLQTAYGDAAKMAIESPRADIGSGTRVILTLPLAPAHPAPTDAVTRA
jgi:LytS/YehU family sensor histidine kinase